MKMYWIVTVNLLKAYVPTATISKITVEPPMLSLFMKWKLFSCTWS